MKNRNRNQQLARARRIRSKQAREMQRMSSGQVHVSEVLQDPQHYALGRLHVYALLRRAPGLSDKGVKKILLGLKIWPMDRVRDLDLYTREEIINDLPPRARRK
jgi:hypothetical protein